jgi:hypothetical protein
MGMAAPTFGDVAGGMNESGEAKRWRRVTPHVSNPYDYINHMFKRP